jgi:4-coumarate--CoA ligase
MFHAATAPSTHTGALRSGHANFIMRRFVPSTFLSNLTLHSITDLVLVPPMVVALVASPIPVPSKKQYLKSIKCGLVGAAPLDKVMQARFQELLPEDVPFTQVWAMTETSCFASMFQWPENDETGSVGRFLPGLDVKVVDDEGTDISE